MKYLGMPIKEKRLNNSDWDGSVGKTEIKLAPWKGKNMSIGGRTILINSSLTNVSLYMLSFYRSQLELEKGKICLDRDFYGVVILVKKSIIWLGGVRFVFQKTKVD
jgi:hypothetical protein